GRARGAPADPGHARGVHPEATATVLDGDGGGEAPNQSEGDGRAPRPLPPLDDSRTEEGLRARRPGQRLGNGRPVHSVGATPRKDGVVPSGNSREPQPRPRGHRHRAGRLSPERGPHPHGTLGPTEAQRDRPDGSNPFLRPGSGFTDPGRNPYYGEGPGQPRVALPRRSSVRE